MGHGILRLRNMVSTYKGNVESMNTLSGQNDVSDGGGI